MSSAVLKQLHVLSHLFLTIILWDRFSYCPHSTDEKSSLKGSKDLFTKSQSYKVIYPSTLFYGTHWVSTVGEITPALSLVCQAGALLRIRKDRHFDWWLQPLGPMLGQRCVCKVRGLQGKERAPRGPGHAAQRGSARSSLQLTQETKHSQASLWVEVTPAPCHPHTTPQPIGHHAAQCLFSCPRKAQFCLPKKRL